MMAWQFLSPVMYGEDMVPEQYRLLYMLNPMTSILVAYRDIFYYKRPPIMDTLIIAIILGILFLFIGITVFEILKRRFSERL